MALTKASSVIADDVTLTAGAGASTLGPSDVSAAFRAVVRVRFTNGGTGPTVPAQCAIQVSEDATAGNFMTLVTVYGNTTASGVVSSVVEIPDTAKQVRYVSGSNTAQNVTERIVLETITAF